MMISVTSNDQIEKLLATPGPAWVMKHSQTCSISGEAFAQVESYAAAHPEQPIAVITVQTHRAISTWAATRLGFPHQSPQLFLLRDGKPQWCVSHWQITADAMGAAVTASAS